MKNVLMVALFLCVGAFIAWRLCSARSPQILVEEVPVPYEVIKIVPEAEIPEYVENDFDTSAVDVLAKMAWGEARGLCDMEIAAVVWCALNRVDARGLSITLTVLAEGQFVGYSYNNPVDSHIREIVMDVLARWQAEKWCVGNTGRVLPKDYLYFTGQNGHNVFRSEYNGGKVWDWSLPDPYVR